MDRKANFTGDRLKTPTGFKPRKDMKEALIALSEFFACSESRLIEEILDERLHDLIVKHKVKVPKINFDKKTG